MNKKEVLDEIETDIKMNESEIPFLKVLILIFSITDIICVMLLTITVVSVQFYPFFPISIYLVVLTSVLYYVINLVIEKKEKIANLKKAKWIATYWLDSKCNFDESFFKYNYPSDNNKEAIEYISTLIEKHIKEYAWGGE